MDSTMKIATFRYFRQSKYVIADLIIVDLKNARDFH